MPRKNNLEAIPEDFDMTVQTIITAICANCSWEYPAINTRHALSLWEVHLCDAL